MNKLLKDYQEHQRKIFKSGLPENRRNDYLYSSYVKNNEVVRTVKKVESKTIYGEYAKPIYEKVKSSKNSINISSEAFCYFLPLEGHPKNLFFYILNNLLNYNSLNFKWNRHNKTKYIEFCELMGIKRPSIGTVNNAFKELPLNNIAFLVKREEYMINPLIIYNENSRSIWLKTYSILILSKGKSPEEYLFPKGKTPKI
jgi:hypothetical protein